MSIYNEPATRSRSPSRAPKDEETEETRSPLVAVTLWLLTSIFSSSKITPHTKGIRISTSPQNVVIIYFASWLLLRGLKTQHSILTMPWIIITTFNIYNQYKDLQKIVAAFKIIRITSTLPWMVLIISFLSLAIQGLLVLQVCLHTIKNVKKTCDTSDEIKEETTNKHT